jgi:hypothetical protein
MTYIGIDNGGSKVGLSILVPGNYWFGTTIQRKRKKSGPFEREIHPNDIWEQILEILGDYIKDDNDKITIAIEEYFLARTKGSDVLPWMQGFLTAKINDYLPSAVIFYPGSQKWKKELIGFKTYGKEHVEERVRVKAKNNKLKMVLKSPTEDTFDAMGIAYYLWSIDQNKAVQIKK